MSYDLACCACAIGRLSDKGYGGGGGGAAAVLHS